MKIPKDKILHFLVSFCAVFAFGWFNLLAGAAFSLGLGLGKEYGDSKSAGNKWDWTDLLADCLGIALACVVLWLIFYR